MWTFGLHKQWPSQSHRAFEPPESTISYVGDHNVLRLYISVNDIKIMQVRECVSHLYDNRGNFLLGELFSPLLHVVKKRPFFHVLHHQVDIVGVVKEMVQF